MINRNRMGVAIAAILLVAVAAVAAFWASRSEPESDCKIVAEMTSYNLSNSEKIAAKSSGVEPVETPIADYSTWAADLHNYASRIGDQALRAHASKVAELAEDTVSVVAESRTSANQEPTSSPPPWVKRYAEINAQFQTELKQLQAGCPT